MSDIRLLVLAVAIVFVLWLCRLAGAKSVLVIIFEAVLILCWLLMAFGVLNWPHWAN